MSRLDSIMLGVSAASFGALVFNVATRVIAGWQGWLIGFACALSVGYLVSNISYIASRVMRLYVASDAYRYDQEAK